MAMQLQILPSGLLNHYQQDFPKDLHSKFNSLTQNALSNATFDFYTSVSAVFSSKIEGESIDLDSFIKHKTMGVQYNPDYTQKIDDLYEAYLFAQKHTLDENGIQNAHSILTKNILQQSHRGKYRKSNMYVITDDGKIDYVAAEPQDVLKETSKLYHDISILLNESLSREEVFYFASMIHLVFVKIHPYEDGNGRTARLLEKWFLAEKLGAKAWYIPSEKYYYDNHQLYYNNIKRLGIEYPVLDYSKALPFALMLANSVL